MPGGHQMDVCDTDHATSIQSPDVDCHEVSQDSCHNMNTLNTISGEPKELVSQVAWLCNSGSVLLAGYMAFIHNIQHLLTHVVDCVPYTYNSLK